MSSSFVTKTHMCLMTADVVTYDVANYAYVSVHDAELES